MSEDQEMIGWYLGMREDRLLEISVLERLIDRNRSIIKELDKSIDRQRSISQGIDETYREKQAE